MSRCKTCRAPVVWAVTERGKRVPLDAEPSATGNILLEEGVARYVGEGDPISPAPRYLSHFATCPDAATHRRRS